MYQLETAATATLSGRGGGSRVKSAGKSGDGEEEECERGFKSRKGEMGKIEFRFLKWGDQTDGAEGEEERGRARWNVSTSRPSSLKLRI